MRIEAQSTSKEALLYGNLLTKLIMDARVNATHYESTSMQLDPINSGTCWPSMVHASSSQRHLATLWHSGSMTRVQQENRALLEMERNILHLRERVVTPITSSLAAMEKRLEKIESVQFELRRTNDEGRKEIMQNIAEVEGDVVQELEEIVPIVFFLVFFHVISFFFQTLE
ncbi:hypothetical protein CJ030_MR7G000041 [Morella rubra]|uniref:Uncharacterized protein n=1 Tax=Morella rubra TaxID=262757 RepID=A0A6A1V1H3_9ROSI|nr:hypothetical protein CJ030_MR7G000041 [Morella rubra]